MPKVLPKINLQDWNKKQFNWLYIYGKYELYELLMSLELLSTIILTNYPPRTHMSFLGELLI